MQPLQHQMKKFTQWDILYQCRRCRAERKLVLLWKDRERQEVKQTRDRQEGVMGEVKFERKEEEEEGI